MIGRLAAAALIVWFLGFVWFAAALPQPLADDVKTDAVVVPTGGGGRIERGLQLLERGSAKEMLVTGVDAAVRPREFQVQYDVPDRLMECCITLGFDALDTRGNARETVRWLEESDAQSIRLVTSDWHMRRVHQELVNRLPDNISLIEDAVPTEPSLSTLFLEYHKLLAVLLIQAWPG
ncbi:YdcF family protein [Altericroceibacterium endophyticum]|uniref:YdcF family protein n=1 Tax=Altericroceibacterium endophyticum TaxID=1808508 RepID=A0A6I4T5K0_9SPHN|nr:YdcF family protein [Altericroceibacterium endophyticum]MXO65200.1 YdcF family protein [Altericroceibacterium endophyticum]